MKHLQKQVIKTQAGNDLIVGYYPYTTPKINKAREFIFTKGEEKSDGDIDLALWQFGFFALAGAVGEIEFPAEDTGDMELEGLRHYWLNQNGNMEHNYESVQQLVSEPIMYKVYQGWKDARAEYQDKLPKPPEVVLAGEPDDPNAVGNGGKRSKKNT